MASKDHTPFDIAIIGLSCRFPGAENPEAFWDLLEKGGDAITEIPPDRFDVDAFYDPDPDKPGTITTRYGGFLAPVDEFDPAFFGIPPRATDAIDPQQRLALEVSWEALEDAAIAPGTLKNREVGVFVGVSEIDYARIAFQVPAQIDLYSGTGNLQVCRAKPNPLIRRVPAPLWPSIPPARHYVWKSANSPLQAGFTSSSAPTTIFFCHGPRP